MYLVLLVLVFGLVVWLNVRHDLNEWQFKKRLRGENARSDALIEADRREAERERRQRITRPDFEPDLDELEAEIRDTDPHPPR
jgi:hypothetical protein